ncbi:tripartite motif-containing protein 16-like isoform X2 [Thalassophryne amazonica]|uniref:tripartite motif-containing protein 16-like isoform X2 n=1 Tax=Thalassophryne amazonica TaxID=390379 RepID=UPI001470B233|nr:tripartite motif-containing protein 16-like isoform X2 [Thalassophryne amazonica]
MAQQGVVMDGVRFCCSVCLDLMRDPVTIPCGHSYCMNCIQRFWDEEDCKNIYSCPQCRQTFIPRPVLVKTTMLADLVEVLKKTTLQAEKQKVLEARRQHIQQIIHDGYKEVKVLQQEAETISHCADKAVEDSEKVFAHLSRLIEKRSSEVKQQIRSQQKTELNRVKQLQEKLEQAIADLKRKDTDLDQLSHTQDLNQFLLNYSWVSHLGASTDSPYQRICPLKMFEDVMVGEPQTRAGFLMYSVDITLDPVTAHKELLLSEDHRKATNTAQKQPYSHHAGRFVVCMQVLSRQSLTGRCYWEVEWSGRGASIAVTYASIKRTGNKSGFGHNDKSWSLDYYKNTCEFMHRSIRTPVSGPVSSRVGIYLDHSAGILCFYGVSATMTLLHRVQTRFTQPLHAGLFVYVGSTAEICDLK